MVRIVPVYGYIDEISYFYIEDRSGHGFLIDPGAQAPVLLDMVDKNGWTVEKILLTHGHFDHIGAVDEIRRALGIPVAGFRDDSLFSNPAFNLSSMYGSPVTLENVDYLDDGDIVSLAQNSSFSLRVMHTPGHTADSVIYYSSSDRLAFTGDTIFKAGVGNCGFPGGDMRLLQKSIAERIFTLPNDTVLYSGHSEPTTVGEEKRRYGLDS